MKRLLLVTCLLLGCLFGSCQCSDKPDVGPVEGQNASASLRIR